MADEEPARAPDSKDRQQQSKALDKITDHVEERQLDSTRVQQVSGIFSSKSSESLNLRLEKELAAVKIDPAHIDVIANELEVFFAKFFQRSPAHSCKFFQIDRKIAERTLREHKGDAVAALRSFLT
ncbi:uncharacterized protein LOC9649252 [Selaginella moellendorffii]|uniref:uncharacterized protein LOC9649252 n=1 Tax=Selaginella moellendorffii TaxID=88036 RepID=UPI000D1C7FE6|nr:uncharacterized protein LOC9649252 [Selaginella moellendorffii]|eukprot:XP_024516008.1 uncharacterized protein LOC9649252 [Selaginella moellendorffii]